MDFMFIKNILLDLGLAACFAFVALMLLGEYRRLFRTDPKAALSVAGLRRIIRSSGAVGYFASFLLAVSVLCLCAGLITLLLNVAPLLNLLN